MAKPPQEYKFKLDNKIHESPDATITGQRIKEIGGVDLSWTLFQEKRGDKDSDLLIANEATVDLSGPGVEHFFAVPPATFGR